MQYGANGLFVAVDKRGKPYRDDTGMVETFASEEAATLYLIGQAWNRIPDHTRPEMEGMELFKGA